jgi:hypothetical protein
MSKEFYESLRAQLVPALVEMLREPRALQALGDFARAAPFVEATLVIADGLTGEGVMSKEEAGQVAVAAFRKPKNKGKPQSKNDAADDVAWAQHSLKQGTRRHTVKQAPKKGDAAVWIKDASGKKRQVVPFDDEAMSINDWFRWATTRYLDGRQDVISRSKGRRDTVQKSDDRFRKRHVSLVAEAAACDDYEGAYLEYLNTTDEDGPRTESMGWRGELAIEHEEQQALDGEHQQAIDAAGREARREAAAHKEALVADRAAGGEPPAPRRHLRKKTARRPQVVLTPMQREAFFRSLTPMQREVLRLLMSGRTRQQIAEELGIPSVETVRTHTDSLKRKSKAAKKAA